MTLKDGYGFGGFNLAPPSKQHLSTPPPGPSRAGGGKASHTGGPPVTGFAPPRDHGAAVYHPLRG